MLRLITIAFSHYNEKARWILERYQVPFLEERYLPLFHFAPVIGATWRQAGGRTDQTSTRFSTPVLVTDAGERICDSTDIVHWVCDRRGAREAMYPTPEVAELEEHFGRTLGPHARRVAYYHLLADRPISYRLADDNVSPRQSRLLRTVFPLWRAGLRNRLRINEPGYRRSLETVHNELAAVAERLDGRSYLCGDRFTAADMAFACMLSPALLPSVEDGYGARLPQPHELRPDARAVVEDIRATPAGQCALRLFREHRREVVQSA